MILFSSDKGNVAQGAPLLEDSADITVNHREMLRQPSLHQPRQQLSYRYRGVYQGVGKAFQPPGVERDVPAKVTIR